MSNIITREFSFCHDRQTVSCEAEYIVDINPDKDGAKVIGEVTNNEGDVFEIADRIVTAEFNAKFWDDVEDVRRELVLERASKLRDFTGRQQMPIAEENELI